MGLPENPREPKNRSLSPMPLKQILFPFQKFFLFDQAVFAQAFKLAQFFFRRSVRAPFRLRLFAAQTKLVCGKPLPNDIFQQKKEQEQRRCGAERADQQEITCAAFRSFDGLYPRDYRSRYTLSAPIKKETCFKGLFFL